MSTSLSPKFQPVEPKCADFFKQFERFDVKKGKNPPATYKREIPPAKALAI